MFKLHKGLEKIEWVKTPLLAKNFLTRPTSSVRVNSIRLRRESFKSRLRNDFSQSKLDLSPIIAGCMIEILKGRFFKTQINYIYLYLTITI